MSSPKVSVRVNRPCMMLAGKNCLALALGVTFGSLVACSDGGATDSGSGGSQPAGGNSAGGASAGGTGGMANATGGAGTGGTLTGGADGTGGVEPFPESEIGQPCNGDEDCGTIDGYDLWCKTNWPGGYCTADCNMLGPCGDAGSVCEFPECRKACTEDTEAQDCRVQDGYRCVERNGIWGCED